MRYRPRSSSPSFIAPLFWIASTYLATTFGPVLYQRAVGKISTEQLSALVSQKLPEPIRPILGIQESSEAEKPDDRILAAESEKNPSGFSLPNPPSSPQDVNRFVQEVVERVTKEVVERSTKEISETKQEVTTNVCRQIVTSIEERCGISTSQ